MQPTAKQIMTKNLLTVPVGSPLSTAWDLMEENHIRHLPVIGTTGEVIGILSQRDLNYIKNPEVIPVEYVMSAPVVSVDQNTPLRSAIARMLQLKISSLLITDQEKNLVGILTTDDLLWYLSYLLQDSKDHKFSFASLFDLQTIGEAARQISNTGI